MGYQVLARKYRPQRFADVAGQDHVTRTLMNAISQGRIAHGYIFSGHRGIGKTTIARILAMALNCRETVGSEARPTVEPCLQCATCHEIGSSSSAESGDQAVHSFDFIEIDAASNRGIDDVRSIRNQASVQPARDKYKIFLLDEAHQITDAAFNAILKTLEEPPEWAVFMMATTEPENIPQTIRSRCQHFSFHAVKFDDILAQLKMIAGQEEVTAEDAALALLAEAGDGSMRDALSIMDQAIASAPLEDGRPVLSATQIRELMGSVPNAVFERLLEAVAAGQSAKLMEELNVLLNAGHSPSSLARQMVRYLRNALMVKLGGEQTELLQISADERARAGRTAMLFTEEELTRNLQIMLRTFDDLNFRQEQRFHLELGLIKLIHAQRLLPLEELLSGVAAGKVGGGSAPAPRLSSASASNSAPASRPAPPPVAARPAPTRPAAPAPQPANAPLSPFAPMGPGWGPKLETTPQPTSGLAPVAVMEAPKPAVLSPFAMSIPAAEPKFAPIQTAAPAPVLAPAAPPTPIAVAPAPMAAAPASPFAAFSPGAAVGYSASLTEGALAMAPEIAPAPQNAAQSDPEEFRKAIVTALTQAGHNSAAQILGGALWVIEGGGLRIEVGGMGKKMIALTVNPQAEKIIRQELQRLNGPSRFMAVPGEGGVRAATSSAAPLAGSVEEAALADPLVHQAKEIFKAEVRSVIDLRVK